MAVVFEVEDCRAVRLFDHQAGHSEIAASRGRVFDRDRVIDPVREPGETSPAEVVVGAPRDKRLTEVEEADRAVLEDPDEVADLVVVEVELAGLGQPVDCHVQLRTGDSSVQDQR